MIAILNGSPNIGKNSGFIAEKSKSVFEGLGIETKIINIVEILKDIDFPFCTACATPCPQVCEDRSEKLKDAFDILRESKGVLMISPVYFGSVSAELKAFWDMARHLRNEKAFYNKVGAAVTVGASRFGGQETTVRAIHDMMLIQGMIIIGNGYGDNMGHQGVCFQKPAEKDEAGVDALVRICNRLNEVSEKLYK